MCIKVRNSFFYMGQEMKVCTKCLEQIPATLEFFPKDNHRENGLRAWCRLCTKEYMKKYQEENRDKLNEYSKKWQEENKEHLKEYKKEWYEENEERLRPKHKKYREDNKIKRKEYKRIYEREKRQTDPQYHLRSNFSKAIYHSLKKRGSSKRGYSWEKIVGYTVKDLMERLERQFTEGMCWDNYGKWHIDHIIPQSNFTYTSYEDEGFQECWKLGNLQPLWALDNLKKGNKIRRKIGKWD